MADTNTLVDQLSGLTVLEVAELVKALEDKWGVSAAAPVAMAAAPGGGGGAAAGTGTAAAPPRSSRPSSALRPPSRLPWAPARKGRSS